MTANEFAATVAALPAAQQNEFFEILKDTFSEEDYIETVKRVSLESMFRSVGKYNAMKEAVKATLFEDIFGHEYDETDYYGAKSLRGAEDFERSGYYLSLPGIHK